MEEGAFLQLGTDQEELRLFLFDAGIYVSGTSGGYLSGPEEAHAGQIVFQLQEGGTRPVQRTGRPHPPQCRKDEAGKITPCGNGSIIIDMNQGSVEIFMARNVKVNREQKGDCHPHRKDENHLNF
jgi:hypothetical protein